MKYDNVYFINGTAYAGKSTMVKLLAAKYNGIACEEIYHNFLDSGFKFILRDEKRKADETLSLVEDAFRLGYL